MAQGRELRRGPQFTRVRLRRGRLLSVYMRRKWKIISVKWLLIAWTPPSPRAAKTESSSESDSSSGCQDPQSNVLDGQCNEDTNTAVCGWDGGDCCERTCTDTTHACGEDGYDCLDPTQDCDPSADVTAVTNEPLTWEGVVGVLSASVVGYCFLGGLIVAALSFVRRQCKAQAKRLLARLGFLL